MKTLKVARVPRATAASIHVRNAASETAAGEFGTLCRLIAARAVPVATLAALGLAFAPVAQARTIEVAGGDVTANDVAHCSLLDAFAAANTNTAKGACPAGDDADSGGDIIHISDINSTFALSVSSLHVTGKVTVQGNGSTFNGDIGSPVLIVDEGGNLTLGNATVANNFSTSNGAGLANYGTLTLNDVTVTGNRAGGQGGGIFNTGALTLNRSNVSNNKSSQDGAGIGSTGNSSVTLNDSTVAGNSTQYCRGDGIGAFYKTVLVLNRTTVSGNTGAQKGSGIYVSGSSTLSLNQSTVSDNETASSPFSHSYYGGGIFTLGTTTITSSTLSGNVSHGDAGAIYSGAVVTLNNSTVSDNSGPAIELAGGSLTLKNSTVAGNRSDGITLIGARANIDNSIIAGNGGVNCSRVDGNANSMADDDSCGSTTKVSPDDLKLQPLANNGGPTKTMALGEGSVAIGAGDASICSSAPIDSLDQRGYARPADSCDIGAFDSGGTPPFVPDTTPDSFSFTAATGATRGASVTSAPATITGINTDASASITGGTFSINGGEPVTSGTVKNNDSITITQTASSSFSTKTTAILTIGGVDGSFDVTTEAADTTPATFSFDDVDGAALSATGVTSNSVTISGINTSASVSVTGDSGALVSINGGSFASSGSVTSGQTLQAEVNASATCGTQTTASVTVGTVTVPFHVNTAACDSTPNSFSFAASSDADPGSSQTSAAAVITGINTDVEASISGGTFSINGGQPLTSGTVRNNDSVKVTLSASSSFGGDASATLTIGGVQGTYTVTTREGHTNPTPFSFDPVTGATPGASVVSGSALVSGLEVAAPISIDNGQFCIGSTSNCFNNSLMTVNNNELVYVRLNASNSFSTSTTSTLTIGGVSGSFSVTTAAQDSTPDAIGFAGRTVAAGQSYETALKAVTGINTPITASLDASSDTSAQLLVNGHAVTGASATVSLNDTIGLRLTPAAAGGSVVTARLTLGTVHTSWSLTTRIDDLPVAFHFSDRKDVAGGQTFTTDAKAVSGVNVQVAAVVSGDNSAKLLVNGNPAPSGTMVGAGDTVALQLTSSKAGGTTVSASLTLGSAAPAGWNITTRRDDTPDAFSFADTAARAGSTFTTGGKLIRYINVDVPATVNSDGRAVLLIDGVESASGTLVHAGQKVALRMTAAANKGSVVHATLTVGGYTAPQWTLTSK
ncbi:MAG TPA: choice-of-anchor Q domain-containing protein [Nevskiaceae bacterium]|nr:choice-of-anchor Q domain-containing protein [Nevskiaceae bacterium]